MASTAPTTAPRIAEAQSTSLDRSSSARRKQSTANSSSSGKHLHPQQQHHHHSHGHGRHRTRKSAAPTPAILITALLAAAVTLAVLAFLIGPELYAFYRHNALGSGSVGAEGDSPYASFAAFLAMRKHERAARAYQFAGGPLYRIRSRILASQWAREVQAQWASSLLASLPPPLAIPGVASQERQQLTIADHVHLLLVSPHTHLPWPLSLLPGLFRLAAAMSLMPIALIGIADFAGYAVFRTLGLQRRRVRIKRTSSPDSKYKAELAAQHQHQQQAQKQQQHDALRHAAAAVSPPPPAHNDPHGGVPFPRPPGSNPHSPLPGQAGGAPLLTPGAYDAEMLLRHRARSRSTSGTESADAEAEWARTGGQFARVSAVREAARRAREEAEAQGVPPLRLPSEASAGGGAGNALARGSDGPASASATVGGGAVGSTAVSPAPTHASLVSPPASPRTRFFRLRLPGVIGPEGALGMGDLTDFEDSGAESTGGSGTSSPLHGFSRASSISSAHGQNYLANLAAGPSHSTAGGGGPSTTIRSRHRPRIGGFTPLATLSGEDGLRSLSASRSGGGVSGRSRPSSSGGESDVDVDVDVDADGDGDPARKRGGLTSSSGGGRASAKSSSGTVVGGDHHAGSASKRSAPGGRVVAVDPNVLTRTLRSLANAAKSALTPGPMDPDAARLAGGGGGGSTGGGSVGDDDKEEEEEEEGDARTGGGNMLGLHSRTRAYGAVGSAPGADDDDDDDDDGDGDGDGAEPGRRRERRTSLFGDEEINSTYSGAGLVSGWRDTTADLAI